MAKIGLPKGSGKRLKVREKSVKSQGILKWILSGNPVNNYILELSVQLIGYYTQVANLSHTIRKQFMEYLIN